MGKPRTFRFMDRELNQQFIALLKKARIKHEVGKDGVVRYAPADEEVVENDVIGTIRDQYYPSWQVLTCPPEWIGRYRDYMRHHDVPFSEELSNGELWFLIPRKHRPHLWKLDGPKQAERIAL